MRFTGLFTLLATSAALVAAQGPDSTTTLTSTTTRYITVTKCNPTLSDCPLSSSTPVPVTTSTSTTPSTTSTLVALTTSTFETPVVNSTTSSVYWSVSNSTVSVGPTAHAPTTIVTASPEPETSVEDVPGVPTAPATVPDGAANGLNVQTSFVAIAFAAALVAAF